MNPNQICLADVLDKPFGQIYRYEYEGQTFFWSIDLALKIIGNRPPIPQAAMTPDMVKQAIASNIYAKEIDVEKALKSDLTKPLIAVVSPIEFRPDGIVLLLIDGWHRLSKSALINHPHPLPCHVLSRAEEEMCRVVPANPNQQN